MNVREVLLTAGGLGRLPIAPGTFGSLPPVALVLVLLAIPLPLWQVYLCAALFGLVFAVACVRYGRWAEDRWGRKDAQEVVADEVAGQVIPLLVIPWRMPVEADAWLWNIGWAAAAFIAFRAFDIAKPPPVRATERLEAGWGVLVDDLIAGVYAAAVVGLFVWLV